MIRLSEIAKNIYEADIPDDKMIKYKDDEGESKEMKASSAKKMEKEHPAKIAYDKIADKGDDDSEKDSGGKLGGGDFDRDSNKAGDDDADDMKSQAAQDDKDAEDDLDSQIAQAQKDADDANQMAQQFGSMTQGGDSRYDSAATAANKKLSDLKKQKSQDSGSDDDLDNAFDHKGGGKLRQIAFKKDGDQKDKLSKIADELDDLKFKYYDERSMSRDRYDAQVNRLKGEAEEALSGGAPKGDGEEGDVEPVKYTFGKPMPTSSDAKVDQKTKDTILQVFNPPRDAERDENGLPTNEEDWDKEMTEVESMYEKARDAYEAAEKDASDAAFDDDEEEADYLSDRATQALVQYEKYKKVRDAYEAKGEELGVFESVKINGKMYKRIKESKKPNPRFLKENYDRIFRSRK